jgi:hypothetical protein
MRTALTLLPALVLTLAGCGKAADPSPTLPAATSSAPTVSVGAVPASSPASDPSVPSAANVVCTPGSAASPSPETASTPASAASVPPEAATLPASSASMP